MNAYLLPGGMGLLIGLLLHWTGFSRADNLRHALGLKRSYALRSGFTAVGWAMALTALLCWLAVIDVDSIEVLPLSAGALLGGAILGISAGLCGFTPMTAFAGVGAGTALEALSVLAGCFAGTLLLPSLDGLFAPLRTASPYAAATLFKVTLDEPFLLAGGFLGQGCAGLLLVVIALCIPAPKAVAVPDESPVDEPIPAPDPAEVPDPEDAPAETFVAILPEEEPLVVDTAEPEPVDESPEPDLPEEPDLPDESPEPDLPEESTEPDPEESPE